VVSKVSVDKVNEQLQDLNDFRLIVTSHLVILGDK